MGDRQRSVLQMKTLLLSIAICAFIPRFAAATPQGNDTIIVGGNTYGFFQRPMEGYWHLDENSPEKKRLPFPKFEATSSANWRGYLAEWSISKGKLYLVAIEGQVEGKKVHDREIMKKRLPIHADWFTGKIFVSIGDFDFDRQESGLVLEFTIENGDVRSTAFHESFKIPMTWNGLPDAIPLIKTGTEQIDEPKSR
ncbi:MAG: hypothetical protein ACKO3V_09245 [Pirellula sp.]